MKRLLFIAFILTGFGQSLYASHILGGEITYEHIDNLKYKVWVTVYRDCNECKIAGGGGGSSTKDCESVELVVQRSDRYTCGVSELDKFTLTRTEIRQILPVCSSVQSSCASKSNFAHGAEAHIFYAIVDFDKYTTSSSCGFDLFVKIFERADDIDNITASQQSFYNYAFINPFEEHNAPRFADDPILLLPVNQPIRTVISKITASGDSVAYTLSSPLKDYNKSLVYADGYSVQRPLTVWCNGSSTCSPNIDATPPIGYSLNPHSGALTFTPIKTGEKAILVFEATTYRRNGGKYQVIGVVRRDIQVETILQDNNTPKLNPGNQEVHLCEGDTWKLDVYSSDQPFQYPDGSSGPQNIVSFGAQSDAGSGLKIEEVAIAQAPYRRLSLSWNTKSSDARTQPYHIYVTATDDNCPLNGRQDAVITIYVHPSPTVILDVKKLWCGNVGAKIIGQSVTQSKWFWINSGGDTVNKHVGLKDTFLYSQTDNLLIINEAKDEFGCRSISTDSVKFSDTELNGFNLKLISDSVFCLNDQLKLITSTKTSAAISKITWVDKLTGLEVGNGYGFDDRVDSKDDYSEGLLVTAVGFLGKLQCISQITVRPKINQGPEISSITDFAFCMTQNQDLYDIINPKSGTWKSIGHDALYDGVIVVNQLDPKVPHELCQEYTVEDKSNGCQSVDTICVRANPIPVLVLKAITICNFTGNFNLNNLISEPFGLEGYNLSWWVNGRTDLHWIEDGKTFVNLALLGDGNHVIECRIETEAGCEALQSTKLVLIKDLEISQNSISNICQGDDRHLTDIFNMDPQGGMWNSTSNFDDVVENKISPNFCGPISLNYTYDQYGCYVTGDYNVNVTCKPKVTFDIPKVVCSNVETILLKAVPEGGTFSGPNVSDNKLNVGQLKGEITLTYSLVQNGCTFRYYYKILIAPSPRYRHSPLPEFICEGTSLTLNDLQVEHGTLFIDWNKSYQSSFGEGNYSMESYTPSMQDIARGYMDIDFAIYGAGECNEVRKNYIIPIKPVAAYDTLSQLIFGCVPLKWTANSPRIANGADWDKTNVLWHFSDPESGNKNTSNLTFPSHTYKVAGEYDISVKTTTAEGCQFEHNWFSLVTAQETPKAAFETFPDRPISSRMPEVRFFDKSVTTLPLTYHWDFGTSKSRDTSNLQTPNFFFVGDTGTYLVTLRVTNEFGCSDVSYKTIQVGKDIQLFIPNAFTPNKKGPESTETYTVIGINVREYHIVVVNRWGEVVYESDDIMESWDGYYLKQLCLEGIYAYRIRAISVTGGEYEYSGTINLIR